MTAFAAFTLGMQTAKAQSKTDSLRMEELQEVVVHGVRAQKNAPFAVTITDQKELQEFSTTAQELPFLFSRTPGILSWSENGVGTGTTYMRIRGAGDSRINVTLDGVPLNSPEDQCVFWANMNSYSYLLSSVQIQRGVGSSTNGDGAIGGTVSLRSKAPSLVPSLEVTASYGSFNTYVLGGAFSTGLLWNHFIFDGAYHETNTDGYIHGTEGRSGSYYGGLTWVGNNFQVRYKNFGNFEKTGQAWSGVQAGGGTSIMDGTYGANTGIKSYRDMYKRGLGRFNTLYENFIDNGDGTYSTERYKMKDGSLWDKTTDNFWQSHNLLSATWDINKNWNTMATLHYTHGYGYYKEFRYNNKIEKIGLPNEKYNGEALSGIRKTDWVRKKGLKQDTYGLVWNLNYEDNDWDIIGGISLQQFDGNHFGYATYISNDQLHDLLMSNGDYKYYDSDAKKFDFDGMIKALYRINQQWDVFVDMQYRHVSYKTDGYNDKVIYNENTGNYDKHFLDIDKRYNFFNPKAGFSFHQDGHRIYGSVAMSHREPERNNFTDNGNYPAPEAESLVDYELGYQYTASKWSVGLNAYYMDYNDQFVQTGMVSDIGEQLTTNIKDSYRMGLELTAIWAPLSWLKVEGNAALSINKIKDFDEYIDDWDDWEGNSDAARYHCDGNGDEMRQFHYDNSTLAFSPSAILNGFVNFHYKGWQAIWHTNFVSRQYLDNTKNADRSLPCYSTSDLNISYTLKPKKILKEAVVSLNLNNIFDRHYASSGWVYSAVAESYGHTPDNRYYQIGFIPMSGFTAMGSVSLKF